MKKELPREEVTSVGELAALIGDWEVEAGALGSISLPSPRVDLGLSSDDLEDIIDVPIFKSGKEIDPALPLSDTLCGCGCGWCGPLERGS